MFVCLFFASISASTHGKDQESRGKRERNGWKIEKEELLEGDNSANFQDD